YRFGNLHFHVVGSIYERQVNYFRRLEKRVQGYGLTNVHFHGFAARVEEYLRDADIFVYSSLYEASPTSVWEAMAMGMPIVSTDVGDVGDHLQNGVSGFIVPAGDAESLAEKVGLLIEDAGLRKKFGEMARAEATKSLDVEVCVAAHSRVYRMVANGARGKEEGIGSPGKGY
ncbi:MAG: glycosyltransferase family 4 protein, partial [Anaerolineae bacterium]